MTTAAAAGEELHGTATTELKQNYDTKEGSEIKSE